MATAPALNPPRLGDPTSKELSYIKRSSAEKQANYWNLALADDSAFGPASGLVVGVAPIKNEEGRYQLVWVNPERAAAPPSDGAANSQLVIIDGQHRSGAIRKALEDETPSSDAQPSDHARRRKRGKNTDRNT